MSAEQLFQIGDQVYVEKSARIDIGFQAWDYINSNPRGIVRCKMEPIDQEGKIKILPESEQIYSIEFPAPFSGGISCQGTTKQRQGQFITAKHLSLCFEASREVITVPQIGYYEKEGSAE
jgi:hypothetical protein